MLTKVVSLVNYDRLTIVCIWLSQETKWMSLPLQEIIIAFRIIATSVQVWTQDILQSQKFDKLKRIPCFLYLYCCKVFCKKNFYKFVLRCESKRFHNNMIVVSVPVKNARLNFSKIVSGKPSSMRLFCKKKKKLVLLIFLGAHSQFYLWSRFFLVGWVVERSVRIQIHQSFGVMPSRSRIYFLGAYCINLYLLYKYILLIYIYILKYIK